MMQSSEPVAVDVAALLEMLQAQQWTLAVAESCTAGQVAADIAAVPGASAVLLGGVVAYADAVKEQLLGVPAQLLERHGAVSEAVVRAMAQGVCERLKASCGVAVSGLCGPGGGTPDKPVGTVWLGVCVQQRVVAQCLQLHGDRLRIRAQAAAFALHFLAEQLRNTAA